mgnify:CR=1 FL=1
MTNEERAAAGERTRQRIEAGRELFPGYNKAADCYANNPEKYGIMRTPELSAILAGRGKKSQEQMVLEYISKHGSITPRQAALELNIWRLGARIWDLKAHGWPIVTTMRRRNGKSWAEYSLDKAYTELAQESEREEAEAWNDLAWKHLGREDMYEEADE